MLEDFQSLPAGLGWKFRLKKDRIISNIVATCLTKLGPAVAQQGSYLLGSCNKQRVLYAHDIFGLASAQF